MAKPQMCNVQWINHRNHISGVFLNLLDSETMVDVTLCAEGERISCHRIILSACSSYFKDLLSEVSSSHAIVILCGISAPDVRSILEFVYKGELCVSADRLTSVVKTAETLKISGLMEVSGHNPAEPQEENSKQDVRGSEDNEAEALVDVASVKEEFLGTPMSLDETLKLISAQTDSESVFTIVASENEDHSDLSLEITTTSSETKKKKREFSRKEYSEDSLSAALEDLASGRSLAETANTHHIPRSTLYARARNYGIIPTISRNEYSEETLSSAVESVRAGASLQTASQMFNVPKTVLWRRAQKDIGCYALSQRSRLRKRYLPHIREAAIRALESGEKINKVSLLYKIPKTTLFREKSRLVEAGRLPRSCLNRRTPNNDRFKQVRLSQAVAACKEGRMSQAAASSVFKVSKTTIWRRLHQTDGTKPIKLLEPKIEPIEIEANFQELSEGEMASTITYCDSEESCPFIILTPNNPLNPDISYQVAGDIIIENVMVPENLEDVGEVIEIQETPSYTEEIAFTQEGEEKGLT